MTLILIVIINKMGNSAPCGGGGSTDTQMIRKPVSSKNKSRSGSSTSSSKSSESGLMDSNTFNSYKLNKFMEEMRDSENFSNDYDHQEMESNRSYHSS
jgi:hypothetical protein